MESSASCKEGSSESGGQQCRASEADAKADQRGVEPYSGAGAQLSQQWSGACLSYTLKVVDSTLLGLLISVLAPLMASGDFPQGPIYR